MTKHMEEVERQLDIITATQVQDLAKHEENMKKIQEECTVVGRKMTTPEMLRESVKCLEELVSEKAELHTEVVKQAENTS